jgi:hypothetical protein
MLEIEKRAQYSTAKQHLSRQLIAAVLATAVVPTLFSGAAWAKAKPKAKATVATRAKSVAGKYVKLPTTTLATSVAGKYLKPSTVTLPRLLESLRQRRQLHQQLQLRL